MLCEEVMVIYSDHYTKHTITLCGDNAQFYCSNLAVRIVTDGL